MTNSQPEFTRDTNCFLIIGSNTSEGHPLIASRIMDAMEKRGAKLVVIDPRETQMARMADLYLRFRPGTDVAVLNGLMNVIISEGLADEEYIAARTEGYEEMKALVEELVCDKYEYLKYDTRSKVGFFYAAANRSTQDKIKEYNGRELSVLLGRHAENNPKEERLYYPGEVPGEWPEDWDPQEKAYRFPDFLPRLLPGREGAVFEDINLDEVLWYIFGEK